jgi:hypothetical protein
MTVGPRCLVIVPSDAAELYTRLVAAFHGRSQVFVLRDRRTDARTVSSIGLFAVGGGELDPRLRQQVEDELRRLGAMP